MRSHSHKNLKNLCYSQTIKTILQSWFYEIDPQKQKDGQ